jgi:hypothetical protein
VSSLFMGEFRKDIVRSVVVAIAAASILASVVASAADRYFGDTVSELIGDYGEYDLQLIVRADMADTAIQQIEEISHERFGGVRIKKGITISGRTNVLVGLPPSMRNAEDIEAFPTQFVNVPGYSGYGVMIEPRIEITGVDSEAVRSMLKEQCEQVQGVQFAFEHHGNVAVVFTDSDVIDQATETITKMLENYTLVDVRFPISGQIDDLKEVETQLAEAIDQRFSPRSIVSSSEIKDEGLGDLTTALSEMKRFLTYYATTVGIDDVQRPLEVGEHVILRPTGSTADEPVGTAVEAIAMIVSAEDEGYRAVVTQGNVTDRHEYAVYEMEGSAGGAWLGHAQAISELRRFEYSLDSGIELLSGFPELADEVRDSAVSAKQLLDDYGHLVSSLSVVRQNLGSVASLVGTAGGPLYASSMERLASALRGAKGLVDSFLTGLGTVSAVADTMSSGGAVTPELARVSATLKTWQDSLSGYGDGLETLVSVLEDSPEAQELVGQLTELTEQALDALYSLDVENLSAKLDGLISTLDSVRSVDTDAIRSQLVHIRGSLPNLSDEEVGRSIRLIDSYLEGLVIPGDRVQLVVSGRLPARTVRDLVDDTLGESQPVTTVSSLGSVQPGVRTQVLRVLGEVRTTIAALAALVLTVMTMLFDHCTVVSLLRKTDARRCVAGGKQVRMAPVYSAVLGAVILSATMACSGASIPLLGPWAVCLIGGGIGLCICAVSEKVSPVDVDEVMAGVAIGLPWHQIMRDIVIPAGRPGVLNSLNRSELSF